MTGERTAADVLRSSSLATVEHPDLLDVDVWGPSQQHPAAFMAQVPLAGSDLYDWIALRRVSGGSVATKLGRWFEAGRRVPGYVTDTLTDLREAELITVIDPDMSGMARVALTDVGIARYDVLCQRRQHPPFQRSPGARGGEGGSR